MGDPRTRTRGGGTAPHITPLVVKEHSCTSARAMRKTHPHPHTMLFKDLLPTHTLPPTPLRRCLQSSTNKATQLDPIPRHTSSRETSHHYLSISGGCRHPCTNRHGPRGGGARGCRHEAGAHTTPTRRQEQDVHTVAPAIPHTYTHRGIRGCAVATRSRPQLRCTADTTNAGTKRRTEGATTRNSSLRHRPCAAATRQAPHTNTAPHPYCQTRPAARPSTGIRGPT